LLQLSAAIWTVREDIDGEEAMSQQFPQFIDNVVDRLQTIGGISAISLGGSRARGTQTQ